MSAAAMASLQRELYAGEEEEQYATPRLYRHRGKPPMTRVRPAMERFLQTLCQDRSQAR